jgi:HK97 gp10 family phage protein
MSNAWGLGLNGLDAILEFNSNCQKNNDALLTKSMKAGAKIIVKQARENCGKFKHPTGDLKSSIGMKPLPVRDGNETIIIGPRTNGQYAYKGYYGGWVENGHEFTSKEHGTSKTAPEAFMGSAFDDKQQTAFEEAARVFVEDFGKTVIQDIDDLGDYV